MVQWGTEHFRVGIVQCTEQRSLKSRDKCMFQLRPITSFAGADQIQGFFLALPLKSWVQNPFISSGT